MKLEGTFTALVTPFTDGGDVDESALRRLVRRNLDGGVTGLVPCGTTGETPTLTSVEIERVIAIVREEANGSCPIIAGSGTNATHSTIENTKRVRDWGCDAALVVTPYYNKPSQEGLYRHYAAVLEAVPGFPVVLYNVPGRTGCNLAPQTVERLSHFDEVIAVKEASGNLAQVAEILERCGDRLAVLSGDDALSLPMYGLGASGVVSVASNVVPKEMSALYTLHKEGRVEDARVLQAQLNDLFVALFVEPNPQPAKAALHMMGQMNNVLRAPLLPATAKTTASLKEIVDRLGLL